MIDLHLHTNASDGHCTPAELVERAIAAKLSVISVTDHDTLASVGPVDALASNAGLRLIPGIEITAVWHDLDVHLLGYFVDPGDDRLAAFLQRQRADRVRRVHAMIERLRDLGIPLDYAEVTAPTAGRTPESIGRPQIARALVRKGHAVDDNDAFARYLAEGRPAYVPRIGSTPAGVVRVIVAAGGVASLAHPALVGHDELIPGMVDAGMQAIEVYHPDHDADSVEHYLEVARRYRLAVSGGSDYHGEGAHGSGRLGVVTLPVAEFARLEACRPGFEDPSPCPQSS